MRQLEGLKKLKENAKTEKIKAEIQKKIDILKKDKTITK